MKALVWPVATCVKRELLDTVKAKKLAYYRLYHEETRELPEERNRPNARNNARCTQASRPCTAWMDNIKTRTGLAVEESIRMTEDWDTWRKYVHGVGVANPGIEDG